MAKKKIKPAEIDPDTLEVASTTELVQLAQQAGHEHASQAVGKENLILLIQGGADFAISDPVEEQRRLTFKFIGDNREAIIPSAMDCDLHCPTCPRGKVIACWADNHQEVTEHAVRIGEVE